MEFITLASYQATIIAVVILATIVTLRIVRDSKYTAKSNQLHHALIDLGKKHAKKSFSVIIALDKKADSIIPLLNHLYAQNYPKLEVIIVIKHTAGKNARPVLLRYKRGHASLNLQLVKHVAKARPVDVIRQRAKNMLVMTMSEDERLSHDFFTSASLDFLSHKQNVIILKTYSRLNNSLTAAFTSHFGMHKNLRRQLSTDTSTVLPGAIYRRTVFTRSTQENNHSTTASTLAYMVISNPLTSKVIQPTTIKKIITSLLLTFLGIGIVTYIIITMRYEDQLLLTVLLILAYTISYAIGLVGIKAYSALDKTSLILLAPIFGVYQLLIFIVSAFKQMPRLLQRRQSPIR